MRKLIISVLMMSLFISGCGSSATVTVDIPVYGSAWPSITSYEFSKDRDKYFIVGNVNFYAPDSDIDTMTINVFDSRGASVYRVKNVINRPGISRGTIPFSIDYINFANETHTLSIYLTDFNGNTSNQVVDTFRVP
ncbi:MAG TPA: hypothetical protein HPP76_06485 [Desulfuromonadales bacterium]|nr:hypothetical protein [Desulfuromonadales bacterium]